MLRPGFLVPALLAAVTALAADAPAPAPLSSKPSPDEVLRAKGLKPVGPIYVLEAEESVRVQYQALSTSIHDWELLCAQMQKLDRAVAERQQVIEQLDQQRQALIVQSMAASSSVAPAVPAGNRAGGPPAPPNGSTRDFEQQMRSNQVNAIDLQKVQYVSEIFQAQVLFNQRVAEVAKKETEIQRNRATLKALSAGIARHYAALRIDPEVKAALVELNKTADPQVVLGPAGDYDKLVRQMAAEQLKDKGVVSAGKRKGIVLGIDKDIQTLGYLVESFQADLAHALGRRQSLRRDAEFRAKRLRDLTRPEGQHEEQDASHPGPQPSASSKAERERLEKLRNEAGEADRECKEQEVRIAAARTTFVESVAALRKGIEESRRKHEELAADSDAKRATALLKLKQKKGSVHMAPPPRSPQALLEQAEKLIRTETVSLEPDKSICWAEVVLNDQSTCKMVVDPAVETVRIPAPLAAVLGLRANERPGEAPPAASGPAAVGKHAVLTSVRIGSITLDEVDCVILPDGDGSPPILGAGFLDQFVSRFEPDAATLTLTRVDVKPSTGKPPARAGAARAKR